MSDLAKSIVNRFTTKKNQSPALNHQTLERVDGWGRTTQTMGWVFRPNTIQGVADVFALAQREKVSVGFRGGGNSYGDAACNQNGIVLDLTRFNRVLDWNPQSGEITVEPGLRLVDLWEYVLGDGWWPPVCTGTMHITIGGGAAMNVHGKNNFSVGTLGDHILNFDLMLPNGEIIACSREENADIFHSAIGGFGMLGCFTRITLQMKRVYSGLLDVKVLPTANLAETFAKFNELVKDHDYAVGWIDCTKKGRGLGRGELHAANYLADGADRHPQQTLQVSQQHLGDTLYGFFPRSLMWRCMRPFFNQTWLPAINLAKYRVAALKGEHAYRQPHAQFHFLLNYFPNWHFATGKGGLIQYQPFVPAESAESVFRQLISIGHKYGQSSYLGVLKRHRPDPFLMTHGLDGFSLALDFQITEKNRPLIVKMCREMDSVVLAAGGRFYPAKDAVLRPETAAAYLGAGTIQTFKNLKQRCDPDGVLQTNFWRRVFASV